MPICTSDTPGDTISVHVLVNVCSYLLECKSAGIRSACSVEGGDCNTVTNVQVKLVKLWDTIFIQSLQKLPVKHEGGMSQTYSFIDTDCSYISLKVSSMTLASQKRGHRS